MSKADKIIDWETVKPDVEKVRLEFELAPELYNQLKSLSAFDSGLMSATVEQALASFLPDADKADVSDSQNQRIYTSEDYDKLLEINPNDYKAWYGRGVVLKNLGRYEEAIASLDKALEIKPEHHKAWYARGDVLKNLGSYEEAIASLDKAIEIKPDHHKAWYARGNALYGLDFYEEAIASYNKAIEFKPDFYEAWDYRSKALDELGCHEEAIASSNKAVDLQLKNQKLWYTLENLLSGSVDDQEQNPIPCEAEKLAHYWRERLKAECPEQSETNRESIISWLVGSDLARLYILNPNSLEIAKQAMEYRYRILHQRYLGRSSERGYSNLIQRLGSLATLRNKIQTWVALSRDRRRGVLDVLQEIIQELLQSDSYIQQQMICIAKFTNEPRLKNALLFASIEEYCLRPVRNQPLIVYRFVNYLRRTGRGGLTQVPGSDTVRLVSSEIMTEDSENTVNLVDDQAIAQYQEAQQQQEQQALHQEIKLEFEDYLQANLGLEAVQWLRLYLQGKSQEEIAKSLNKPLKEVYRLQEKISYHAVRVFALKGKPEFVGNWLEIDLQEHNLGLTQKQFGKWLAKLTAVQREIVESLKAGKTIEVIAQQLELKTHQVMGEWTKAYLVAQALRTQE